MRPVGVVGGACGGMRTDLRYLLVGDLLGKGKSVLTVPLNPQAEGLKTSE